MVSARMKPGMVRRRARSMLMWEAMNAPSAASRQATGGASAASFVGPDNKYAFNGESVTRDEFDQSPYGDLGDQVRKGYSFTASSSAYRDNGQMMHYSAQEVMALTKETMLELGVE